MKCNTCGGISVIDLTDEERRINVHICAACKEEFRRTILMYDTLTLNAAAMFNIPAERVTDEERQRAKDAVVSYFREGSLLRSVLR